MVRLTEPHAVELVQRLQLVLYRRAVLDDCDAGFASELVERLLRGGTGIVPEGIRYTGAVSLSLSPASSAGVARPARSGSTSSSAIRPAGWSGQPCPSADA